MPKVLTISGMVVAALLLLTFLADLAMGVPFGRASTVLSIGFVLGSAALFYLSWNAWRDLR